jgi:signal transduction histidine kinase
LSKQPSLDLARLLHALRQPLGSFRMRLELLRDEPLTPNGKEQVAALQHDMVRIAELLEEIAVLDEVAAAITQLDLSNHRT